MNDMKGRNRAPPTAEGQAALRVGVHLRRHIDGEKQGYHLLYLSSRQTVRRPTRDGGRNLRWRSQIHPESFIFPPPPLSSSFFLKVLNKSVFVRKFLPSFADGHIAM